jgi:GNAT superfamily N-acetyltransferase
MVQADDTPVFRRAGGLDVAAVTSLVESAYRGEASRAGWTTEADLLDGQRTDIRAVEEAVEHPDGLVLLSEVDDALVGCCQLRADGTGRCRFGMFAVRPDRQGKGIGDALLAEAERVAGVEWGRGGSRWRSSACVMSSSPGTTAAAIAIPAERSPSPTPTGVSASRAATISSSLS